MSETAPPAAAHPLQEYDPAGREVRHYIGITQFGRAHQVVTAATADEPIGEVDGAHPWDPAPSGLFRVSAEVADEFLSDYDGVYLPDRLPPTLDDADAVRRVCEWFGMTSPSANTWQGSDFTVLVTYGATPTGAPAFAVCRADGSAMQVLYPGSDTRLLLTHLAILTADDEDGDDDE